LETDGAFVFSPERWFSEIIEATPISSLSQIDGFDYVLTSGIEAPSQEKNWLTVEKTISPIPNDRQLRFVIAAESNGANPPQDLKIKQIKLKLQGDALTPKRFLNWLKQRLADDPKSV
jgi:hypothetical protein